MSAVNLVTPRPSRPSTPQKPALAVDTFQTVSPDLHAVDDMKSSMKATLHALGKMFDALSDQTARVSDLGPALQATHQIGLLREQIKEQQFQQEARIQEVKAQLREKLKEVTASLFPRVDVMIRETVEAKVQERVRQQLLEQIPSNLRQDIHQHKHQILQVQTALHNSEARRYNALLKSSAAFYEPLRPLLRPYAARPSPLGLSTTLPTPLSKTESLAPSPYMPAAPAPTPTTTAPPAISLPEIEPPTPSPLFPRKLTDLFILSPDATRRLVLDYGLVGPESDSYDDSPTEPSMPVTPVDADMINTNRDKNLNKFMAHIGVPYQIVPGSSSPQSPAPLITRVWK